MSPERILPGSAGVPDEPAEETPPLEAPVDAAAAEEAPAARETTPPPPPPVAGRVDEDEVDEDAPLVITQSVPVHRGRFRRLYYGESRVDFVRRRRLWFAISAIVISAGAISLGVRGLNFGIDFVGGTSWTVASKTVTVQQANAAVASLVPSPQTTILGQPNSSSRQVEVEAKLPKGESAADQQTLANAVAAKLATLVHGTSNDVSVSTIGPSWGGQITHKAIVALIVFFILIALYISLFFEWRMALAAIIAVLHDILVTVGIYSLTGLEVTPDTVVAFLTILGYSLYDTIVVFDRVRDNVRHLTIRDRITFSDVVNLSMNQTLARSINTSLVAIMPILSVLILGAEILGAQTLEYFGLALLVGLTTGAYSSIFIASPLVAVMKEREPRYRAVRERLAQRGGDRVLLSASAVASGAFGDLLGEESARQARAEARANRPATQPNTAPRRAPAKRRRRGGRR